MHLVQQISITNILSKKYFLNQPKKISYFDFRWEESEIGTLRNFSLVTVGGKQSRDSLFGSKHRHSEAVPTQSMCTNFLFFFLNIPCNCQMTDWEGKIEDLESAMRNDSDPRIRELV